MGSEVPQPLVVHVTGFKRFHGVDENPTQAIALLLADHLKKKGLPPGMRLGSVTVLETAGIGGLSDLLSLLSSASSCSKEGNPDDSNEKVVWLHMGVNSGATKFTIERKAVNEATFRCCDELGWQPQRVAIVANDGEVSHIRETDIDVARLVEVLVKKGHNVVVSDDAGRFVCNYVYYQSLCHAKMTGAKCLFLHVPPFSKIDGEKQVQFVGELLDALAMNLL